MSRSEFVALAASAALVAGCSYGAFQTAHTQPPATVSVTPGVAYVFNSIDDEAGRGPATNGGAQVGGRVGITERLDAGVGSFMRSGLKADVKLNLLDPRARLAIAPRLGAGYRLGREIALLEGGAIASYRVADALEPYLGVSFANHWIEAEAPSGVPASSAAPGRGSGDGLLQLSLGVQFVVSQRVAILAEYGHWFPANNDPGDFYRFLSTDIAGLAVRLGRVR